MSQEWFLEAFEVFVAELHKQRRLVESSSEPIGDWADRGSAAGGSPSFEEVRGALTRVLRDQQDRAGTEARIPREAFDKAQYAMVALADEVFMRHLPERTGWQGLRLWSEHPLEQEVFDSTIAGQEFYTKADAIIQGTDRWDTILAEIYASAIALGFKGKPPGERRPADYQGDLQAKFVPRGGMRDVPWVGDPVYRDLHTGGTGGFLPRVRTAIVVLACVVLLVIVGTTLLYGRLADGIFAECKTIENAWNKISSRESSSGENVRSPDAGAKETALPRKGGE